MVTMTREQFLKGFDHEFEIDGAHSCLDELRLVESGGLISAVCGECGANARIGK